MKRTIVAFIAGAIGQMALAGILVGLSFSRSMRSFDTGEGIPDYVRHAEATASVLTPASTLFAANLWPIDALLGGILGVAIVLVVRKIKRGRSRAVTA